MSSLIAFTGLAGCGKTTAALTLVQQSNALRMSFAEPIRDMLQAMGLTLKQLTAGKQEPIDWLGGKTPRELMQTLGTEWGRDRVTPSLWVNIMERRIIDAWRLGERVVIDDCRFDNEARMVQELGGMVIDIERPGLSRMAHASERGVSPELITARIYNDCEQPQFVARVLAQIQAQKAA